MGLRIQQENNGYLQVNLSVSSPETVHTRASEADINELAVFLFNQEGEKIQPEQYFSSAQISNNSVTLKLVESLQNSNAIIYAVANANTKLQGLEISTLDELERVELSLNEAVNTEGYIVMTGSTSIPTNGSVSITLSRIVAKLTVKISDPNYSFSYQGQPNYIFFINKGIKLGCISNENLKFDSSERDNYFALQTGNYTSDKTQFVSPTQFCENEEPINYLLLVLTYWSGGVNMSPGPSDTYWYCLPFETSDNDGDKCTLNIEPNHYYTVDVIEILHPGYSTPVEAMENPENKGSLKYKIIDHAPEVFSMASDGTRELGISQDFDWDFSKEEMEFIVKWYSRNGESDYQSIEEPVLTGSWLNLSSGEIITPSESEEENPGIQKKYKLTFNELDTSDDPTASVQVTWKGLSRILTITRNYDSEGGCNIMLIIDELGLNSKTESAIPQSYDYRIDDYWKFIAGEGTYEEKYSTTYTYPVTQTPTFPDNIPALLGIDESSMGSRKIRNNGIHFPVMYGPSSYENPWTYSYYFDFKTSKYGNNAKIVNVRYNGQCKDYLLPQSKSFTSQNQGREIFNWASGTTLVEYNTLITGKPQNYDYFTGSITFTITYGTNDENTAVITIPVYHTGFFHFDSVQKKYYYYEVISTEDSHWLDRNIGATVSSEHAFNTGNYSTEEVIGQYWKVADENRITLAPDLTSQFVAACPPGYHLPTKTEWDNLRNNSFIATSNSFASFKGINNLAGDLYLPQVGYKNNGSLIDYQNGYYWTGTIGEGLEANEIGKSLKVLTFYGGKTSFINGNVENYTMPVRCVAGKDIPQDQSYLINFYTKGITDVFLYSGSGNYKTGVFLFPGAGVCNYTDIEKTSLYSYTSFFSADELSVFFTCTDNEGKVWIISKDPDKTYDFNEDISGNGVTDAAILSLASGADLSQLEGWPVWVGANFEFDWNNINTDGTKIATKIFKESMDNEPVKYRNYRIYWPVNAGTGINVKGFEGFNSDMSEGYGDDSQILEHSRNRGDDNHTDWQYYYYDFSSPADLSENFSLQFTNVAGFGVSSTEISNLQISDCFQKEIIKGNEVWVGFVKISNGSSTSSQNPTGMSKGLPYRFATGDIIYFVWNNNGTITINEQVPQYVKFISERNNVYGYFQYSGTSGTNYVYNLTYPDESSTYLSFQLSTDINGTYSTDMIPLRIEDCGFRFDGANRRWGIQVNRDLILSPIN